MHRILPLFILLYSCNSDPSLVGHWHAEITYPTEGGVPSSSIFTFDILNDTLLSVWENPPFWAGQPGYHDEAEQTFSFGVECLATKWGYQVESADLLRAHDLYSDYAKKITLIRHNGCTFESHLFLDSRLNIQLPEAIPGAVELTERSLTREYFIGPANKEYKDTYPGPYRYQLGDKIITEQDTGYLELYELQHLIKLPESKRGLTKAIVYANANTSSNALNELFRYSYANEHDTLYFAMLKRDSDTTVLHYLPVPVCNPTADENLAVQEWLSRNSE